jgi:hypothetical protein
MSNLGGGYPDDALAGVPLNWILDKAEQTGLVFNTDERNRLSEMACVNGKQYDSRQGLGGGLYRYMPRKIASLMQRDIEQGYVPKIHESVLARINNRVDGYAPIGLPEKYEVVAADGSILPQSQEQNPIQETPEQAQDRMHQQEKIWNLVWWKRTVYFMTVGIFILLASFPYIHLPALPYEEYLAVLAALIGGINAFLPSFLNKWLVAYQSHPGAFLIVAAALAGVLYVASRLQQRIFDQMRAVFDHPLMDPARATPRPTGAVHWLRTNRGLKMVSKWWKEQFMPWVLLAIVALFILRGIFMILDSSGFFNRPTPGASNNNGTFNSTEVYWDSGVNAEAGKTYKITLTINSSGQAQWQDKSISAPTSGFEKWYLIPWIPLRRHIAEPWFKPIARIGEYGNDDYPLNRSDESDANTLISKITARKTGELYLFVNDAVLPVPKAWQVFYKNNCGAAHVTIEPVDCNPCAETER